MNKILFGVVVAVVVVLVGYTSINPSAKNVFLASVGHSLGSKDQTIKIGAALGLTGECANYGEGELKAAQLAIAEANAAGGINGKKIDLTTEDTACSAKGSVNAMHKLIDVDTVQAIVGLTWGDSYQAGYTVNNAAGIVSVAPSAALEALQYNKASTDYVFSTWFPEKSEIDALESYAEKKDLRKFAIVNDEDTFGAMMGDLFATHAPQNGLTIEKKYKVPVEYGDYRTIIAEIKKQGPDGVAIFFQAPSEKAKFLKQAKDLGLKIRVFTDASVEDPSLLENYGPVMDGLIFTHPQVTGDNTKFQQKFKDRYGTDSSGASDANAYDATRVLITALGVHEKSGVDMKMAVENVQLSGTAVAEIKFDRAHQITGAKFEIKTVLDGQFVPVD